MFLNPKNQKEVEIISPSEKITNKSGSFFSALNLGGLLELYHKRHGDQPYAKRYATMYNFAGYASYGLQVLSVLFALSFAVYLFSDLLPSYFGEAKIYVAGAIGLVLLLALEIAKRETQTAFFDSLLKSKAVASGFQTNYFAGIAGLLFLGFSIYSSVRGAEFFVELQTDKTVEITQNGSVQRDSVNRVYQNELSTVRSEIADIKKRNTYKGNTWIAGADKKLLLAKETLLASLIAQKDKALQGTEATTLEAVQSNQKDTSSKATQMFWFSLACEVLTLVTFYFIALYIFKSGLELENLSGGSGAHQNQNVSQNENQNQTNTQKPIGFSVPTAKRNLNGRNGRIVFAKQSKPQNPIGFKFGQNANNGNRITPPVKDESRITPPVKDLGNGNRICKHCGEVYTYKHHLQQYCTEACRITAWEIRTGKTFKKGQNKPKSKGFDMIGAGLLVSFWLEAGQAVVFILVTFAFLHGLMKILEFLILGKKSK